MSRRHVSALRSSGALVSLLGNKLGIGKVTTLRRVRPKREVSGEVEFSYLTVAIVIRHAATLLVGYAW